MLGRETTIKYPIRNKRMLETETYSTIEQIYQKNFHAENEQVFQLYGETIGYTVTSPLHLPFDFQCGNFYHLKSGCTEPK